jgi:hypothetical protein
VNARKVSEWFVWLILCFALFCFEFFFFLVVFILIASPPLAAAAGTEEARAVQSVRVRARAPCHVRSHFPRHGTGTCTERATRLPAVDREICHVRSPCMKLVVGVILFFLILNWFIVCSKIVLSYIIFLFYPGLL